MRSARSLAILVSSLCLILAACRQADAALPGHAFEAEPAPAIQLTDSQGDAVSLAQYRGRPAVVTFLYTDCPDVCPVIGRRIGEALRMLGSDGAKVAVLAVSVDPEGDTREKAQAFFQTHGLDGAGRHFLLGDLATLAPVWLAYGVGTVPIAAAQRQQGESAQFGRVGHTDATFLIDRDGRKRTLLRGDASADDIARGLRILLR